MTTRYYEERECPHGQMNSHNAIRLPSGEVIDDEPCPGGQRRELTDARVVDNTVMAWPGVEGLGGGRYLVVELNPPIERPDTGFTDEWLLARRRSAPIEEEG